MRHRTLFSNDPGKLFIPDEEAILSDFFVPNYKQHVLICDEATLDKTRKNWLTVTVNDFNCIKHNAWLLLRSTKTCRFHRWVFDDMTFFTNNGFVRYKLVFKLDETVAANVDLPEKHKDWRMHIYCDTYDNCRPGHKIGPPIKNLFPVQYDAGKYSILPPDIAPEDNS